MFVRCGQMGDAAGRQLRCHGRAACAHGAGGEHSDIETSRSVYNFVIDFCVTLGADPKDLVPFEKYAAAAQAWCARHQLRSLSNGVPNIERADKLVRQSRARWASSNAAIDAQVAG